MSQRVYRLLFSTFLYLTGLKIIVINACIVNKYVLFILQQTREERVVEMIETM